MDLDFLGGLVDDPDICIYRECAHTYVVTRIVCNMVTLIVCNSNICIYIYIFIDIDAHVVNMQTHGSCISLSPLKLQGGDGRSWHWWGAESSEMP